MSICQDIYCTCLSRRVVNCLAAKQNLAAQILLDKLVLNDISEYRDNVGATLLHYSIIYGNDEMTQHLINKGCNVNAQDVSGVSPLMVAVEVNDPETVFILLDNYADIYVTDIKGAYSLELAFISRFDSSESNDVNNQRNAQLILDMLIDKMNYDFSNGRFAQFFYGFNNLTKLVIAIFGSVEMVRFMLKNGYAIDYHEARFGRTALHYAIIMAKFENARILIKYGANVDLLDRSSCSALSYYNSDFEDVDENSEVLASLLSYSIDLFTPHSSGFTDIERLAMFGKEKSVRAILQSGINVDAYFTEDRTFFYALVANENLSNLDFLKELNYTRFNVNQNNWSKYAPLLKAVMDRSPRKVDFLLRHGADATVLASHTYALEYSPSANNWDESAAENNAKVIELLLQYGFDLEYFYRCNRFYDRNYLSLSDQVILALWALKWTIDRTYLAPECLDVVRYRSHVRMYFDICIELLEELKRYKVYDNLTMYTLLIDKEEHYVTLYVYNQEFILSFSNAVDNWAHFETYYVNLLKRRLDKLVNEAKFQNRVLLTIKALTGLSSQTNFLIIKRIIDYLDEEDLRNLCKVQC